MSEPTHGPTQHHQPEKAGNPDTKGFLKGNTKWYLIGALAVIAVFTFIFVRKSNANSSTTSSTTGTGSLDPTTNALLQSALSTISAGGYGNAGSPGGGSPGTSTPTGPTSPAGGAHPEVMSLPNGKLGWDSVTFPSVQAVGQWLDWNAGQTVPGTRSAWNAELASLGATGYSPVVPYNPNAPLGSPGNTGNPLDTE